MAANADQAVPVSQRTPSGPDPTSLTTQALERSIANLKELQEVRITAVEQIAKRLEDTIEARPAAVVQEINHLKDLMIEKFKGVDQQFAGRDTALAAALLAQKTSVDDQNKGNALSTAKTEAGFTKQIDGISALIGTMTKGVDDKFDVLKLLINAQSGADNGKLNDIKDRITVIEARKEGGQSVGVLIFSLVGAGAGLAAVVGFIMMLARGTGG